MLDEKLEYREYTGKVADSRLVPELFMDALGGLPRALVTIARQELDNRGYFADEEEKSPEEIDRITGEVKRALGEWLGFHRENKEPALTAYNGWLARYYSYVAAQMQTGAKVKTWVDVVGKKKRQYAESLFSGYKKAGNNINAITYEKMIAEAVHLGPLKTYYLLCKEGYDEEGYSEEGKALLDLGNKPKDNPRKGIERLLKLISVYLITKKASSHRFQRIRGIDVAHWTGAGAGEVKKFEYFKKMTYGDEKLQIVTKEESKQGNNTAKIAICQQYLDDYDFQVRPEEELEPIPEGYLCFKDCGGGKPLALCKQKKTTKKK